jgi:RHS repeat-associated protein
MLNAYESRRRYRVLVYLLALLLGLPPGFAPRALAASKRTGTMTRPGALETFRNPQFSSAAHNRWLFSQNPKALLGGGGDSFAHPAAAGYGRIAEPETQWLTDEGKVEWFVQDLFVPGVGLQLAFQRVWRGSVTGYDGPLGNSWDFAWNKHLSEPNSTSNVTFYDMGRKETYTYSLGSFTSPAGRYDSLVRQTTPNPDEYTRTDREGSTETYEYDITDVNTVTWYRLKTIADLNGNTLTFAYDSTSKNLTKVTDTLARDTTIAYDGNDRISTITDSASRVWAYDYDGNGNLTKVTTPAVDLDNDGNADPGDYLAGKRTAYKYDGSNRLTEVLRPDDVSTGTWKWEYDSGSGQVTKHTKAGDDMTLVYDTGNRNVTVADREGLATRYYYDASLRITKRQVENGATDFETTWAYDSNDEVTSVIFPRGNRIEYTYDGSGNIVTVKFKKDGSDSTPPTWVYTYASNSRVSTLTDPRGNAWDFDYDSYGNLTHKTAPAVTVPSGIAAADKNGNSNYDGTIAESWAYNSAGLVTTYTDPVGTDTAYTYTTVNTKPAYLATVVADSGGLDLTTAYGWDSKGNVTSVTDPGSHSTTYTVNALNQVQQAVEPGSVTKKTWYDKNDRVTQTEVSNDTTAGNGWFVIDRAYDLDDNLTSVIEDLGSSTRITTTYGYDDNDRLTEMNTPQGQQFVYGYDVRDLPTSVTHKAASAPDDAVTTTVYDENGNRVTVTDPRGKNTVSAYDLYDRVTKVTQPLSNYVEYAYDRSGHVTSQTWKNASNTMLAQTLSEYDEANRLYQTDRLAKKADLSTDLGDGWSANVMWRDERGAVLEHSGDICGCSVYEHVYDAVGRQVTAKDPMGNSDPTRNLIVNEYDDDGNVTKTTRMDRSQDTNIEADKDIVTEYVYDARHRLVTKKELLASGPTYGNTVYYYGLRGQLTKVVDPESDEVRYEHNEQLWKTKDTAENGASDVVTEYVFDDDGRVVTYRAKNSNTGDQSTVYTYDRLGRVVTTTWPDSDTTVVVYDKAGNAVTTTDPNTTVVVVAFDDNNRLTSKALTLVTNVLGATSITFGYDGMNRMTQASTSEGGAFTSEIDWTFNTLSKPQTEKQVIDGYNSGAGRTLTYTWDEKGQKTGVTYPVSGSTLSYTRDALDRVDVISRNSVQVVDYAFNGKRVIEKAYPGSSAELTYDDFGRLTQILHKDTSSGHTLAEFDYGYDKSHQVTSQDKLFYDDANNTRITTDTVDKGDQYDYDGAKRLVTVLRGVPTAYINDPIATNISNTRYDDLVEYVLDQTGNRLTRKIDGANNRTYVYNTVNELTTEAGNSQGFYDNGTFKGVGASTTYKYTGDDHFAWYDAGVRQFTWHYDALGRQIARTRSGSGGASDIHIYYDGLDDVEVCSWISSTETQLRRMVYGERINELLEHTDFAGPTSYYAHADQLDSVMLLVESDGDIAESYRYKEFGEQTVVDSTFAKLNNLNSNIGNWKRYTGQEHAMPSSVSDPWYFYRARAYRADAGRFVQRDPEHYREAANMYTYAMQKPLSVTDPTGLMTSTLMPSRPFKDDEPVPTNPQLCPNGHASSNPACHVPLGDTVCADLSGDGLCDVECNTSTCGLDTCLDIMYQLDTSIALGKLHAADLNGVYFTCVSEAPVPGTKTMCGHTDGMFGNSTVTINTYPGVHSLLPQVGEDGKWKNCGPLGNTVMHEMSHVIYANTFPWFGGPEDVANNYACWVTGWCEKPFNPSVGLPPGYP